MQRALVIVQRLWDLRTVRNFSTRDEGILGMATVDVVEYRHMLEIICERHREISDVHHKNIAEVLKRTELLTDIAWTNTNRELSTKVRLEIESFYLFAKMLLDEIARLIEFFFGPGQGLSLASHDSLTKYLAAYSQAKHLDEPDRVVDAAIVLKADIADFRDYQISHHQNPRTTRVIMPDASGARMMLVPIYPTERELQQQQKESKHLAGLLQRVDAYLIATVDFIEHNQHRTKLSVLEEPQG
ncbi:MAG TPA: hypothetical protein VLV86_24685 [Vicinamibacterales bacterium]|nr:hypothetical protein [Vicinamibacterales bacterium]